MLKQNSQAVYDMSKSHVSKQRTDCQWRRHQYVTGDTASGIDSLILDKYFCYIHNAFRNNRGADDSVLAQFTNMSFLQRRELCSADLHSSALREGRRRSSLLALWGSTCCQTAVSLARESKTLHRMCSESPRSSVSLCDNGTTAGTTGRLSKFDSHSGIMQLWKVPFSITAFANTCLAVGFRLWILLTSRNH